MLKWTKFSYIVNNAPIELKHQFTKVASNEDSGFSQAVKHWLKELDR
jgi:hydroxymethylpyrimidine pyrophosphatase-like HAD family hydrolase